MKQGRMIIITGSPGTGKSTISSIVAKESNFTKSVHMHTDDFYHYIRKGAIPPFLPESQEQNIIVIEAFLEAAKRFARGGYDVMIDGIVGPWFLDPWLKTVRENYEVHYIILRASKEETMKRAINRSKLDEVTNVELVERMWEQFNNLGHFESKIIDTTNQTIEQSVSTIKAVIEKKSSLLTI
uniref:AAA family ATPase n=1 Tax=Robertmurraya massiliosenegalensis TaxID=1287657 RepID=UPI00031418D7|nr:AAA family ATPase [Robertmurraya massiliosenegalensis]